MRPTLPVWPRWPLIASGCLAFVLAACAASAPPAAPTGAPTAVPSSAAVVSAAPSSAVATAAPRPAPLAPAFGPATDGALFYATGSQVFRVESPSDTPRPILDGYDLVLPSKDGSKLVVGRSTPSGLTLAVADAFGADIHPLPGTFSAQDFEIDWAPSSDALAVISPVKGRRALQILPADGSDPRTVPLETEPDGFWYLPDGRILFQGSSANDGGEPTFGAYIVDPASGKTATVAAPEPSGKGIAEPASSPDGKTIVYHAVGGESEDGRLRLVDADGSHDRPLGVREPFEAFADQSATFSPDGRQVLFTRFTTPGTTLTLSSVDGGPARAIGEMLPGNDMAVAAFSPDGTQVIAFYPPTGHLWLLDATGTGQDVQLQLPVKDMPTWQRVGE